MRTCQTCLRNHKGLKCPIKKEIVTNCCDHYRGHCQRANKCFWHTDIFFGNKVFTGCLLHLDGGCDECECWLPPWEYETKKRYSLEKQRRMGSEIGREKRENEDYQEEVSRICQLKRSNISGSCPSTKS